MKKQLSKILALGLSLTMFLTACGAGKTSTKTEETTTGAAVSESTTGTAEVGEIFVIGNPQPLTGVNAQVGESANMAAELAVKVIN